MGKDPKFTQCVACLENLHYTDIDDWQSVELPYCPNEDCVRYGLLTIDAAGLLADKVKGYTEKEQP